MEDAAAATAECSGQLRHVAHLADSEGLARLLPARDVPQPDRVHLGEAGDEQDFPAPTRIEQERVAGRLDAREPEEVRRLAVGMMDVAVADGLGSGGEKDEPVRQAMHQGAPVGAGGLAQVRGEEDGLPSPDARIESA